MTRFMRDNKHYQSTKVDGFWDFVTRDPGDYAGRHRLDGRLSHQVWTGCQTCMERISS